MRNFGLWATNSGQNPDIDKMIDLVRDGCYTLMHSSHDVAEAREIKRRYPDADILVRHHCPNWDAITAMEWARQVVGRMRDYKRLGITRVVFANEMNLEPFEDFSEGRYRTAAVWSYNVAHCIKEMDADLIVHFPAYAAGHSEDQDDLGYVAMRLPEVMQAIEECDVFNDHCYWDPEEGPMEVTGGYGGGLRFLQKRRLLQLLHLDRPIWIDEAGPWAQPWRWEQVAAHSRACQTEGAKVTYFLWADPTNNPKNTINQWWGRVEQQQLDKLSAAWEVIAMMPVDVPPPIVEVWGHEAITPWRGLCEECGRDNGVDPLVLGTMIFMESTGDPDAINEAEHAIGLMQIRSSDAFAGRPTEAQLLDPDFNVIWGSGYLARQWLRYDDLRKALMAYNAGPGWMDANPDATDTSVGYVAIFASTWTYLWGEELPWLDEPLLSPPFSETRAKVEEAARHVEASQQSIAEAHRWLMESIEELRRIEGV